MPSVVAIDARLIGGRSTGDSTYWRGLVEGLRALGPPEHILLLSNAPCPPTVPRDERLRWVVVPGGNTRFWSWVRFPIAARQAGARVIHTQYALSPLAGRAGITTVHDVSFLIDPTWFGAKDRIILGATVPASIRRARRVLTVSESSKREIERLIPSAVGKVRVTPLAPAFGVAPVADGAARRAALGVTGRYWLAVGTSWPRKNIGLAVAACRIAGQRLVLTGRAADWGAEPHVHAVGYVDEADLSALYEGALGLLVPSFHEGFGLPVIEAFACGCPVICSSGGALPEVSGGAATIVDTFDVADWAEAIRRAAADSSILTERRRAGLKRAAGFSWKTTAELTLAVYREVVL